jgi:hypothetical protein
MTVKTPVALRWTENAEAERVCALALLECEPEKAAVSNLVEVVAQSRSLRPSPARWLADRLCSIEFADRRRRRLIGKVTIL